MPSCAATRRASSTSATLQQPESDSPPHSLRVTPVTSCPCSSRRAAATEESTPPLIATRTREPITPPPWGARCSPGYPARPRSRRLPGAAQLRDGSRDHVEGDVDVGVGRREPEAQPERRQRVVAA